MEGLSVMMLLMMSVIQGTGSDLVDYVDTKAYWESAGVEMTVETLSAQLTAAPAAPEKRKASAVRRLLAIRTLGELKQREALSALRGLLTSREPFVAEYARQAIAAIEGKPFARPPASAGALARDVMLLPAGCAMVTQVRLSGSSAVNYDDVIKMMGPMAKDIDADVRKKASTTVSQLANRIGNVRLEALTMGLSGDPGPETGFMVLVVRGRYDAVAMRQQLKEVSEKVVVRGGVSFYMVQDSMALAPQTDDRFVMVGGASLETLPLNEVAAALKTGVGKLAADPKMAVLLASADRTKAVWAVARMTEAYREVEVFAPFDAITLVGDGQDGIFNLKLTARGTDAAKVAKAVKTFEAGRREAIDDLSRETERMPLVKDLVSFMKSIRVETTGAQVTVTGSFKGGPMSILVLPLMMGTMRASEPTEMDELAPK